jgi:hypothetical protein
MKKLFVSFGLAIALATTTAACGGGNECKDLSKKICDGKDDAYCEKTNDWIKKEMTDIDGKPLGDKEAGQMCKMILDDKETTALYKAQAEKELAN